MAIVVRAVLIGILVAMAGTIPRNLLFAVNLRYHAEVPWAIPLVAAYLWLFWRYLQGAGPPASTATLRREGLRAHRVAGRVWTWALLAGGLGIAALVLALKLVNRMIALPAQTLPDLSQVPPLTVLSLLLAAAPIAGVIEEAAFRGYMQGPIERRHGMIVAIFVTGTMFAVAHLDFSPILWPYYVAVAAIYGIVAHLCRSILPAIVLHTGGNLYSNLDLWRHGQAEWQAAAQPAELIWQAGTDRAFWLSAAAFAAFAATSTWAYFKLARVARTPASG